MTDGQWLWLFVNQIIDNEEHLEKMCQECRDEVTSENKCIRNFKRSIWIEEISNIMFLLFGILFIISISGIITAIVTPYLSKL